jgi:Helix-turn-helix domain
MSKQGRRRLTPDERRQLGPQLAAGYRTGATVRLLATINGLTYGVAHRLLREEGVEFRPRGGPGNRQRMAILQAHAADAVHQVSGRQELAAGSPDPTGRREPGRAD